MLHAPCDSTSVVLSKQLKEIYLDKLLPISLWWICKGESEDLECLAQQPELLWEEWIHMQGLQEAFQTLKALPNSILQV